MSEYCHHCGTTISEDIATLCPLCASKPDSLRREEIDEFAAKLKTGAIPAQIVNGRPDPTQIIERYNPENTES